MLKFKIENTLEYLNRVHVPFNQPHILIQAYNIYAGNIVLTPLFGTAREKKSLTHNAAMNCILMKTNFPHLHSHRLLTKTTYRIMYTKTNTSTCTIAILSFRGALFRIAHTHTHIYSLKSVCRTSLLTARGTHCSGTKIKHKIFISRKKCKNQGNVIFQSVFNGET